MVDAFVGADLADVDQALDAVGNLHKGAEFMILVTGPSTCEPTGKLRGDVGPWVGEGLLEAERDAAADSQA